MDGERRQHRRYEVTGLSGSLGGRLSFQVVTLSRSGLLVTMAVEPHLGQVFDLELPLPGGSFRCPGRIAFVGEDPGAPRHGRFRVGIGFTLQSDADEAILEELIDQLERGGLTP